MSDPGYARMVRMMEMAKFAMENQLMLKPDELDIMLGDARAILTKEVAAVFEFLVWQAKQVYEK